MLSKTLFILSIILIFKNSIQVPSNRYNFIISNVTCNASYKPMKLFECKVKQLATNFYSYSGKFMFSKNMNKNLYVRYYVDISPISKKKLIHFIDLKMSVCSALETSFELPMVQKLMIEIRRTTNVPYQCPFKGNFTYIFENLTFSDKFINSFMPHLHFVQGLEFYESNKRIGGLLTIGSLLPHTKARKS